MTFRTFYLFYLLSALLLFAGLLTRDVETVTPGWHTTIIVGMWSFFIPASIGSLLIGLIYHYSHNIGRPVRNKIVMLHFLLMMFGLIYTLNIFQTAAYLMSSDAPDAIAMGSNFIFVLLGPLLLIASLIVFIVGLVKAKRL